MIILLANILLVGVVGTCLLVVGTISAPLGYEDQDGFHLETD